MNKNEMIEALKVLTVNHMQEFSTGQMRIWFDIFQDCPVDKFEKAIKSHITDPDSGRFFPTPAHILRFLIYTEAKVKLVSAQEFDENSIIDGTGSHTASNESNFDRSQRRREYITSELDGWHDFSTAKKLYYSQTLTKPQYLALENKNLGVTDES